VRRDDGFYVPIAVAGCAFQTSHSLSELLIRPNHPFIFSSPTNRSDRRPLQITILAPTLSPRSTHPQNYRERFHLLHQPSNAIERSIFQPETTAQPDRSNPSRRLESFSLHRLLQLSPEQRFGLDPHSGRLSPRQLQQRRQKVAAELFRSLSRQQRR